MSLMPAIFASKLYLKDELKIKILSKLFCFKSFIKFKDPKIPSCRPFLFLLSRSKIIILSIFLLSPRNCITYEISLTRTLTGTANFFAIASINGKKITISPIPILF